MTLQHILTRTRRLLDQVPLARENVATDSSVIGSPSVSFSDENLTDRVNEAIRAIVPRVKAEAIPQTINLEDDAILPATANVEAFTVRLLPRRIFLRDASNNVYRALRRSVDSQQRLEGRYGSRPGRQATIECPVFTWEDGQFRIYPTVANASLLAYTIRMPSPLSLPGDRNAELPLDERFEKAIISYVASTCYQTMQRPNLSDWQMQVFEDEIDPYTLDVRLGSMNDQEVNVE